MKYTIELTDNQKKQMDLLCELAHRYIGFNPKLEMVETTNVEDTNEYQIGYKVGLEEADATNTDLIDELKQVEYIRGLEDGYKGYKHLEQWFAETCFYNDEDNLFPEYNRRQADTCCLEDIITDVGFVETLNRAESYEEKKKVEEEIKIGDEVKDLATNNIGVVLGVGERILYITKYDYVYSNTKGSLEKTGRHFGEIEQLLDKLRGEDNE